MEIQALQQFLITSSQKGYATGDASGWKKEADELLRYCRLGESLHMSYQQY